VSVANIKETPESARERFMSKTMLETPTLDLVRLICVRPDCLSLATQRVDELEIEFGEVDASVKEHVRRIGEEDLQPLVVFYERNRILPGPQPAM